MPKVFAAKSRTLCEVLREVNSLHQGEDEHSVEVRGKLREAFLMAKKMSYRLYKYSRVWDKGWWKKQAKYAKIVEQRMREPFTLGK